VAVLLWVPAVGAAALSMQWSLCKVIEYWPKSREVMAVPGKEATTSAKCFLETGWSRNSAPAVVMMR
jgi:hypothetical protein